MMKLSTRTPHTIVLDILVVPALLLVMACAGPGTDDGGGGDGSGDGNGGDGNGGGGDGNGGGGDGSGGGGGDGMGNPGGPFVVPSIVRSGFDGTHAYRVPVIAVGLSDATWSLANPAIGDLEPIDPFDEPDESWAMLTTKQAGETTLTATQGDVTLEVTVIVAAYDVADWTVGQRRYANPENPGPTRPACSSCHGNDVFEHDPFFLAWYTDEEIVQVARTGMVPDYTIEDPQHTWDLTDAEAQGIVPYLRSIEPTITQPPVEEE